MIGLVLQGGGSRGAFTAGVLDVLMENGVCFPYVIGTSAGTLNGYNYVSGDVGRNGKVAVELVNDPKFVGLGNFLTKGKLFDLDYLFGPVEEKIPFNKEAFEKSKTRFVVSCCDVLTNEPVYFEKGKCDDFQGAIKGSCALSYATVKPIKANGRILMDGGTVAPIPCRKALADGCSKVVVVSTRDRGFKKNVEKSQKPLLSRLFYGKYPKYVEGFKSAHANYNEDVGYMLSLEKEGKAFIILPEEPVNVKNTCRDKKKLNDLYLKGKAVAFSRLKELKAFIDNE